jgi:hypothetical protein
MRTTARRTLAVTTTAAALLATAAVAPTAASAGDHRGDRLNAIGLADGGTELVHFRTDRPGHARTIGEVRGLVDGETRLVGIDFRVQNGALYGVADKGGIYTLSEKDAKATKVGFLSVPLQGSAFGVDFNPAANALRVVSDAGQNLRQPFPAAAADGAFGAAPTQGATVADGALTNPATPPATAPAPATGVTGAAYTNNDLDPTTATSLFDVDTVLDRVALQSPANAGTLAPTGALRVDAGLDAGFDVYSATTKGVTTSNRAFATLSTNDDSRLYAVDLLTGTATEVGEFDQAVTDLAIGVVQR